jgi:hypothetical protein
MTRRARKRAAMFAIALLPVTALGVLHQLDAPPDAGAVERVRFAPLDVYVDSGDERLGAWQVEVKARPEFAGRVTIVGIGSGDAPFVEAPYYDQRALLDGERVIIADFETDGDALRTGRSRVAQVQLRIEEKDPPTEPAFDVTLHSAARHDGAAIDAAVEAVLREAERDNASDNDDNESET